MPEAPVRQQEFRRPGEFKPAIGQGENPGFFWIDLEGTIREGGPDEARQGNGCWGAAEVQGLNGPMVCCPDDAMRELRRRQKLQCLQPGQNPRELTEGEMAGLQFKDGRPVTEATEDCKPFVCDQNCDQQKPPYAQDPKAVRKQKNEWAMEDTKTPEEKEKEKAIASRNAEIERQEKLKEELKNKMNPQTKQADRELKKAKSQYNRIPNAQKNTPAGQAAKNNMDAAKERKEALKREFEKQFNHIQDWIGHLREQNRQDQARIDEIRKKNAGMPSPDDNDPKWREKYCQMFPNNCPERYQKFGTGKGRGVDTWVVNPKPDEVGGGLPIEDSYGEESQFLCIPEGGGGFGGSRGFGQGDQGGGREEFGAEGEGMEAEGEVAQRGNCPRGGRPEGVGFDGEEGQSQEGLDVVRRDNCNSSGRRPKLPGDDVINPGDPNFFQCPEMGCPNQRKSSITLNNCPDNSFIGKRAKMSCNPYNGPAGAIDPTE